MADAGGMASGAASGAAAGSVFGPVGTVIGGVLGAVGGMGGLGGGDKGPAAPITSQSGPVNFGDVNFTPRKSSAASNPWAIVAVFVALAAAGLGLFFALKQSRKR